MFTELELADLLVVVSKVFAYVQDVFVVACHSIGVAQLSVDSWPK